MSIKKLGKKFALSLQALALLGGFGVFALAAPAYAVCDPNNPTIESGAECAKATSAATSLFAPNGIFATVANTLIFLTGAVAVIFLIIGGLRYVISQGDAKNVEGAKNTILYAIIGIVVAILSFAAVQFVINALRNT